MNLPLTERSLHALKLFLEYKFGSNLDGISLSHSGQADAFNREKKPRYLAYTMEGSQIIFASRELENVPEGVRTAVLLHELGHIILQAFGSDEAEVKVDAWCSNIVPESGYKFISVVKYRDSRGMMRTAKSLETVSNKFLRTIGLD